MKTLATAALILYAVASGGVVLVEYSCHETGTRGVTTAETRACYAPTCGDENPAEVDPCCDHACCDIDLRVHGPDEQIATSTPDFDTAVAATAVVHPAAVTGLAHPRATENPHPPAAPFPGFDRPIRI